MGLTTGFKNSDGKDIGSDLVEKSYLIDRYPELANTFRFAGLWTWGTSSGGVMGDNTLVDRSSPVQTVSGGTNWKQLSCGNIHTAAIKTDGTLWLWGLNGDGLLGDNTIANKSSPVQTVSAGTNWKQVAGGGSITAAIKTDGTLWLWGSNNYGQLGRNDVTHRSSPIQTISGGTNWKSVTCGVLHTAAVKTDGTLWLWGNNPSGQLGDNTAAFKSSPVQVVGGGTNWRQVACGNDHTAAIKTDGTLWLWGQGFFGNLGTNLTTSRSSPVQTVAGGTNWKEVSGGNQFTAAIKTDGTLWLWGAGTSGQLGDNTRVDKSSPVQTVSGGTNWQSVTLAVTGAGTAAIKTDGTLWLWGSGSNGQLGDNTVASKSSPVQTVAGGTNWKTLGGCGQGHAAAIRDDSSDIFGDPM